MIFVNELTKLEFILSDSTKKNEIILNGKFLKKNCKINAFGTVKNNLAYKVIVDMPEESPDSLGTSFGKLQKLLTIIYGPGTSRYQQFKVRESLLFNVPRLKRDVRKGDFTKYITDSGDIILEFQEGYISLTYLDRLNNEINKIELQEGEK